MKKIFLGVLFVLAMAPFTYSQSYSNAIGLRGGLSNGITFKHSMSESNALEGILSVRDYGFTVTGLYEFQKPLAEVENLYWYYGFGAHLGLYDEDQSSLNTGLILGADGIIGMEYNFSEIPINISLDYKPGFNLIGYTGFVGDEFALSLRYTF